MVDQKHMSDTFGNLKNAKGGWKTLQHLRDAHERTGDPMECRSARLRQFLSTYQKVYAHKGLGGSR